MKMWKVTQWSCATVAMVAILGAVAALAFPPVDIHVGIFRLRITEPLRALAVAVAAASALLVMGWKSSVWRRVALLALALAAIVVFPTITKDAAPMWPTGDSAMIEMYTLHAAHGRLLVGAYSQYGWHHPGPMMFYLMAPVYMLGGHSTASIWAGAAIINLLSLSTIAWLLWRRESNAIFGVILSALLLVYLVRLPGLMTNAWNPHLALFPFVTFLMLSGEALSGDVAIVPLLAVFGSFVIQAHVGYAPTVLALLVASAVRLGFSAWKSPFTRGAVTQSSLVAVALLEVVWLLPVAQELTGNPGNVTRLWEFFVQGDQPQPLGTSWNAWAGMLAGVFRTDFHMAIGWGWTPPTTLWPSVLGGVLAISLAIIAVSGSRLKQPFLASLAFACFIATALAFWSVRHLRGPIVDNQIFWISALGLVSAALMITAALSKIETRFIQGRWRSALRIVPVCAVMFVGVTTLFSLVDGTRRGGGKLDDEPQAVQVLTRQTLDVLPTVGGQKPLVRVDPAIWGVAAGVVLQLVKNSVPVAADELADFFGPPLYPTGSEDTILFISGPDRHTQLAANFPMTSIGAFRGSWFVDAIGIREYGAQER